IEYAISALSYEGASGIVNCSRRLLDSCGLIDSRLAEISSSPEDIEEHEVNAQLRQLEFIGQNHESIERTKMVYQESRSIALSRMTIICDKFATELPDLTLPVS
ncbi:hypothetical protein, partial [Glycomyces salinus]|uniref:hypothetical protein n=1 Tax=Glycomyces salinus TaxID=980294 RepID=UPI001E4183A7